MQDKTQTKVLVIVSIIGLFLVLFSIKYFGTNPNINIEKDGFCKISFRDEWDYSELKEVCINQVTKEEKAFTQEEFRTTCPKTKFFDLTRIYSDCFNKGEL